MITRSVVCLAPLALAACGGTQQSADPDLRSAAERFFTGVFACEPAMIDATAAEDVIISYPIFESLFDTPAIQGRTAVRDFSAGFCSRWSDPRLVVHEALQDDSRVVLLWEFSAQPVTPDSVQSGAAAARESWGGISFFRFDESGRVVEEVGEESTPGPMARLRR